MTLDDNLVGILMSAKKEVVEKSNGKTIRFRKIYGIAKPLMLYRYWFFIYTNCPMPYPL